MDHEERTVFLKLISKYGYFENDFEIREDEAYPPTGTVSFISGTWTLRYKRSGATKIYEHYGPSTWFPELENDLKNGLYKKRGSLRKRVTRLAPDP